MPTPVERVLEQVDQWLASPSLVVGHESGRYWSILRKTVLGSRVAGARIHDARIACICLDYQVEALWTADRDFLRFPALKTVPHHTYTSPLAAIIGWPKK